MFLPQLVSLFCRSLGQFFATTCLRFLLLTRTVLWNCFILQPLFLYIRYSRNTEFLCILYSYVYIYNLYKFCTYLCIILVGCIPFVTNLLVYTLFILISRFLPCFCHNSSRFFVAHSDSFLPPPACVFLLLTQTVLWNCFILEPLFLYIRYSRNTVFLCILYSYVYIYYLYKFCTYLCIFLLKQYVDASKGIFKPVVLLFVQYQEATVETLILSNLFYMNAHRGRNCFHLYVGYCNSTEIRILRNTLTCKGISHFCP